MATGVVTDFVIRDQQYNAGLMGTVTQNINAFNAGSAGTMVLSASPEEGDYTKTRFFERITTLITRRVTGVGALTGAPITMSENISVKCKRKVGPIEQTIDSWRSMNVDPSRFSALLGSYVGEEMTKEMLNAAVNAVEGALSGETALIHDYTATGTLAHAPLVTGLSKFGDAAGRIKAWVGHSKPFYDLMGASLSANGNVADFVIFNGVVGSINRPFVVTDSSYLLITGSPDAYVTLGLVPAAVKITITDAPFFVTDRVSGVENMYDRFQGEYSFNVEVKGYQWDTTNGGANPTDAALGTSTNWDEILTNDKDKAGVYVKTD